MGRKTMQTLIFVLLGLSYLITITESAMSVEMINNSKKLMKNMCINRSQVSAATVAKMKTGEFPDDRKLKCYISCCLQFMKVMNKDKVTYDIALKQINSQLPTEMRPPMLSSLEACRNVEGKDGCEVGFNFAQCSYQNKNSKTLVVPT